MNNNLQTPGQTAGFLGTEFQPLLVQGDPATLTYHAGGALKVLDLPVGVTIGRLESRWSLLRSLDVNPPSPCTETERSPVQSGSTSTG